MFPAGRIQYGIILIAAICVADAADVVVVVCVVFPHSWRWGGVAGHRITGIWTVFTSYFPEWKLSILVELLELGATVLKPNFDLK